MQSRLHFRHGWDVCPAVQSAIALPAAVPYMKCALLTRGMKASPDATLMQCTLEGVPCGLTLSKYPD